MGKKLTSQNDQPNDPYYVSQKNHPSHNGHVEIDLFKMTKWSFWHLFKLGVFLLYLLVKKYQVFSSGLQINMSRQLIHKFEVQNLFGFVPSV